VYSVTLYCSDPACDSVFDAEGSLESIAAALCPFCGCTLGELTCAPVDAGAEAEAEPAQPELHLWVVHAPVGRRLRRRRTRKQKRLAAAA
jgi:hypothetical protein